MLSLSRQYAGAGEPREVFGTLAAVVGSTRRWAHLTELLAIDCWIFSFYAILYRFALVPRPVAAFGLFTVVLHLAAIPLPGFLGYAPAGWLGAPMGLSQLALGVWLVTRGFTERDRPLRTEAHHGELCEA
jgi:Domain of unknown function (DUF4386)